jgi:hypothetical protein
VFAVDLARFRQIPLQRDPFDYVIVPDFIRPEARPALSEDFPVITGPGSYPVRQLRSGPAFAALLQDLHTAEVRQAFEEKFSLDLKPLPTVITVRGRSGPRDGHIHTDLPGKVITVLIYMNSCWEGDGGRLRLLRSARDLDDVITEVPPVDGTLLAFRRTDNSFHGHKPFIGERRVIQLNWVTRWHSWWLWRQDVNQRLADLARRWLPAAARSA